ncbi:MAG: sialidase family protein [Armatimonadota bacterium]
MRTWGLYRGQVLVILVILVIASPLLPGQPLTPSQGAQSKDQFKTLTIPPPGNEARRARAAIEGLGETVRSAATGARRNVQVSKNQSPGDALRTGASETTIAGAAGGRLLVAGWNDGEGFAFGPFVPDQPPLGLSGYGFSSDRGRTWTDAGAPGFGNVIGFGPGTRGRSRTGEYITRGDPWLDSSGTPGNEVFFYANLAIWTDDAALPPAGVSVHFGRFTGPRFDWFHAELVQSPNYPGDFLDKEAMAVDDKKTVFVTVTNFIELCKEPFFGFGQIELYRRSAAGWARRIIQPDESLITDPANPRCGLDGIVNQGSAPAVGPKGELYVAWERGWFSPLFGGPLPRATIAFKSSTNQGNTFGPLRTVRSICSNLLNPPAGYNRTTNNDFPRIAVAHKGRFTGRIYITFQDCSAAHGAAPFGLDTDVYVSFSDNGGDTWSTPVPLHKRADGKIQFWPVVSVDKAGIVHVAYYESLEKNVTPDPTDFECQVRIAGPLDNPTLRRSRVSSLVDVIKVRSRDGGATWSEPARVTTETTNWCKATPINSIIPNFGDYIDSRSIDRKTHTTWADGRNGGRIDHIPTTWYATHR